MREPRPLLALVDPERLQPVEQAGRKRGAGVLAVVEDEHPDASRLAVAPELEDHLARVERGFSECAGDGPDLSDGSRPEEGEGGVEVRPSDAPGVGKLLVLPGDDCVDDVVREAKRAEEAKPLTALDAIGRSATRQCRLCARTRRRR